METFRAQYGPELRAATKWGAIVGAGLYLSVGILLTVIGEALFGKGSADLTQNPGLTTLGCLEFFLLLFAYSAAGFTPDARPVASVPGRWLAS